MKLYKQTSKDKVSVIQINLQKHFLPSDTWGCIETNTTPEQADKDFRAAILSDAAAQGQKELEQLAERCPNKYGHIVPADGGKTIYSVFPVADGARILFISNYAQRPLKRIFTAKTMGEGMKIHTGKVRNRFEPEGWRRESWFFVAYALSTGNTNEFATVSRYS